MVRVPGLGLVIEFIRTLPTEHLRAWLADWRGDKALEPRVHHHHRVVDRCVLPTTGGAGAVVPVQPGRLARHCTSAHGIPFWALAIWVSYLIVATPMHRHKTLAEPNADAMDDNNETEEQH